MPVNSGGGARGPVRRPTAQTVRLGNPGHRKISDNEPLPDLIAVDDDGPFCPEDMPANGRIKWNETVSEMKRLGLLTGLDITVFEMFCRQYAIWKDSENFLAQHGDIFVLKDEKGKPRFIQSMPQVARANRACEICIRLAQELGLTPAARSRIEVTNKPVDVDKLAKKYLS